MARIVIILTPCYNVRYRFIGYIIRYNNNNNTNNKRIHCSVHVHWWQVIELMNSLYFLILRCITDSFSFALRVRFNTRRGKWVGLGENLAALSDIFWLRWSLRIFHNRWQECSQPRRGKQSTNHRLVLIDMNLAFNVFITDIVCQEGVWLVVYFALRLRFSYFAGYSAVNDKLRESRHHHHHHHTSVMELGYLLTHSGLTYPEVSSKVCHDFFCQLENSVSLPWVICYGTFYLNVSSFSCIPGICPELVLFLIPF
jgi:hypothetical protein